MAESHVDYEQSIKLTTSIVIIMITYGLAITVNTLMQPTYIRSPGKMPSKSTSIHSDSAGDLTDVGGRACKVRMSGPPTTSEFDHYCHPIPRIQMHTVSLTLKQ